MNTNIKIITLLFSSLLAFQVIAVPPEPELGQRWVLNHQYSDEFNGNSLDESKWRDYFLQWQGRSPAKFMPEAVSVGGGNLQIKNGVLSPAQGDYYIQGGAVQSLEKTAHFGYYEASFKASKITMSTTFWMSNSKEIVDFVTKKSNGVNCPNDKFSQELDIAESIGGTFNSGDNFRTQMNFNTHYRYIDCNSSPETFYSKGNNAVEGSGMSADASLGDKESWEAFHTYAVNWKDANEFDFYVNNNFAGKVFASIEVVDEPFPRPMGINMVTETYNWATPYPTTAELNNDAINTSYYDWVRSYENIDVDETVSNNTVVNIFEEEVKIGQSLTSVDALNKYDFILTYKANQDREIHIILKKNSTIIKDQSYTALAGYAKKKYTLNLDEVPSGGDYQLVLEIRPIGGDASSAINTSSEVLSITGAPEPISHDIPGLIEAEDYKLGGEGIAYHDSDATNTLGEYRNDDVDIEICKDDLGGFNIGWIAKDEWLEYDINVSTAGQYDFSLRTSALSAAGSVKLFIDGIEASNEVNLPITTNWQNYQNTTVSDVNLSTGQHTLRVNVVKGNFNFNYIDVTASEATTLNNPELQVTKLSVFPNQAKDLIMVHADKNTEIKMYDTKAKLVKSLDVGQNNISNLALGIYYVVAKDLNNKQTIKVISKIK